MTSVHDYFACSLPIKSTSLYMQTETSAYTTSRSHEIFSDEHNKFRSIILDQPETPKEPTIRIHLCSFIFILHYD